MELMTRDPEYNVMINEGWAFEILPWQVETTWSWLPEFAQRPLNASNSVGNDATEWETAITMNENYENMENPSWEMVVDAATAGNPQCSTYAWSIQKLVEFYGGGTNVPYIVEQDEFAKTMSENRCLGEEFTKAIADTTLNKFDPMVDLHEQISINEFKCGFLMCVRTHFQKFFSNANKHTSTPARGTMSITICT